MTRELALLTLDGYMYWGMVVGDFQTTCTEKSL